MNLNSNSNEIEIVDLEMQNTDFAQITQNAQNLHNENTTHDMRKSSNIEVRIEKIIDEKMKKIQSHLNKKLNQMMKLIQSRLKTTSMLNVQNSKNSNSNTLISLISRNYKNQNASKNAFLSTS